MPFDAMPTAPVDPSARRRVLIIEDDDGVRTVLASLVEIAGYAAVPTRNPGEANAVLDTDIAAMVLDLRLPGSRGDLYYYDVARRFPRLRDRTVFVTGDASVEAERLIAHTGCIVRHKPFVTTALIATIRELVEREDVLRDSAGDGAGNGALGAATPPWPAR
ncbi:MAG: response regulator [Gemmatimonadetes bacterium]|nr:response regulator [Gemmatimonadota bacterium]